MSKVVGNVRAHLPMYLAGLLVVFNALIDAGYVSLPLKTTDVLNAVLAAAGIGVLHIRQNRS